MAARKPKEVPIRKRTMINVDKIDNADYNPQEQDKVTFNKLVARISKNGFEGELTVATNPKKMGRYVCLGGNHTLDAARVLGMKAVPCFVKKGLSQDKQKAENVALNMVRGKFNMVKLAKVYEDLAKKHGPEKTQDMMGFVDEGVLKSVIKQVSRELPPDLRDRFEEAKGEIKTMDQLAKILNEMFTKYGKDLDHGFMVFEFGGETHYWVKMNKKLKKLMEQLTDECRETGGQLSERLCAALGA